METSGCPDLNWGPLRPERSALPGCATPRLNGVQTSNALGTISCTIPRLPLSCIDNGGGGVNVVTLIGNLATDVELKDVAAGQEGRDVPARRRPPGRDARRRLHHRLDVEPPGGGLRRVPREGRAHRASTGGCAAARGRTPRASAAARSRSSRTGSSSSTRAAARRRPSRRSRRRIAGAGPPRRHRRVRRRTARRRVLPGVRPARPAGRRRRRGVEDRLRRVELARAVRAGRRGGRAARARAPRPLLAQRAAARRPAAEGPARGAVRRRT